MRWSHLIIFLCSLALVVPGSASAALLDRVNDAFRQIHGREPKFTEWQYWAGRVERGEKTTFDSLVGAIAYQNAHTGGSPTATAAANTITADGAPAAGFVIDRAYYPSLHNPNFLPEGTLVTSPSTPNIYYLRGGKKSWVLPSILARWFNENHYYKGDIVMNISDADLARYPTATSVNKLYIGKVLQHPSGTQFYIDDKLRKRLLPGGVRVALRIPAGNLYTTSAGHLSEFPTGPPLTADKYPGGFVMYDGPYHGGRIWKTEEITGGTIVKRLYLKDRFYEADGYPDESQRAPATAEMLARHPRGANIDRYPDGWLIGSTPNIFVMQAGDKRLIVSLSVFAAMGYTDSIHVHREYPELYAKYAQGQPIRAFKTVTANGASMAKGAPAAAPSTSSNLLRVRPAIRTLIGQLNDHFRFVFDRDPSIAENQAWVDYLYLGEVSTREDLLAAMRRAKTTGRAALDITPRTAVLPEEQLERHWFSYLFYFVHQQEPTEADREYWYARIKPGDRDTIEKLGGTLQWVKENFNATRR
ncbi:MAG: hypothetical protein COT71_01640 [Candidatus Andersenbacteria bacterium CG10_big_fil_rev_8_21_14_0_10_54_11]|uniref:DUF4214 domain-containing protein n=1 Tax=Candidatus Andersenbacteria bacterium CG10_big_fil_rev_8_21_14_0_10_54_11 TaxID=1974485 RepID=A0A2M6WZU0_9BACT|nr:MAG: hypothetical protein COT71_01640 [Candidatus Andersenbacteria bacterium CG10_big_fil_rev_8_21_14_0_10_54_11]